MSSAKSLIAEAVSQFPLQTTTEWCSRHPGCDIERIEADAASISTVDCLFDGECRIVVKGDPGAIPAHVFGRFDGRRAEIDRIVFQ
ncbi:hypothetical protein [Chthonobacter albigriseus]|uniref:hypothetical protein n=1 Tax=Chthonobacter albigriseus TaxID=1683161 RepID=UPI0015EEA1FC|nr:hypothetical protein [Chthonobacter albigriseus]